MIVRQSALGKLHHLEFPPNLRYVCRRYVLCVSIQGDVTCCSSHCFCRVFTSPSVQVFKLRPINFVLCHQDLICLLTVLC